MIGWFHTSDNPADRQRFHVDSLLQTEEEPIIMKEEPDGETRKTEYADTGEGRAAGAAAEAEPDG